MKNYLSKGLKRFQFNKCKAFGFSNNQLELNLILPDLKSKSISIDKSNTMLDLENEIKKMKHIEHIEFRTWDNSIISKNSSLDNTIIKSNEPIFLKIDRMEWQELKKEEAREETVPLVEQLKKINKNPNLTTKELEDIELSIHQIRNFYNNSIEDKLIKSEKHKNLSFLIDDFYDSKIEFSKMTKVHNKHSLKAEKKALLVILLGGSVFILELLALYYGTFIYFSWDVTEPITYLVTCVNLLLALIMKRKFGTNSAHEYLKNRFLRKKLNKIKFFPLRYDSLQAKISQYKNKLN